MAIVYVKTTKELNAKMQEHAERGDKCLKCWSGCNCNPQSLHRIVKDFPRKSAVSVENDKGEKIRYVLCKVCAGGNVDKAAQKEYQKLMREKNRIESRLNFINNQLENEFNEVQTAPPKNLIIT